MSIRRKYSWLYSLHRLYKHTLKYEPWKFKEQEVIKPEVKTPLTPERRAKIEAAGWTIIE
jgi:hypothetical protein